MNEQLQTALAEMLGKANSGIDAGASFLQAQLPDVIQQLLAWKATQSVLWFSLPIIALVVFVNLAGWICRKSEPMDRDEKAFVAWITLIPVTILAVIAGCNMDWLQILIAPKIYLIEYAASLAK